MTVGLLLITHNAIGEDLLRTATGMLSICPLSTETLPVSLDSDPEALLAQASGKIAELDHGDGVLVLTDLYGSTPGNIASRLQCGDRVMVVAGVNLPMLIRVLNYPRLGLRELAQKALSGGGDGIFLCSANPED